MSVSFGAGRGERRRPPSGVSRMKSSGVMFQRRNAEPVVDMRMSPVDSRRLTAPPAGSSSWKRSRSAMIVRSCSRSAG
jgi:hypothetical protein